MAEKNGVSANVVVKSGLWYTISNFAFRAIAFITTPIFSRVLTKGEYGEFNNITSWIAILFIFTSCDLYTSIIRAKLDYEDDLERYGLSVLTLGSIITGLIFAVNMIFLDFFSDLMGIQPEYFIIIYIYLFTIQGFYVYITIERAHYRYKQFSILTGIGIVGSCFFSLLLVLTMDNKLDARVYGQYIPYICIGIILYILVVRKGKEVNFSYWKYGFFLSIPLVPHLLSMTLLSSSDKIMITKMVGADYNAIYSLAYIVANIVAILIDSMNKAWAPWFLDTLKLNGFDKIRKAATPYFCLFIILIIGVLLVAPEMILVLGGEKYKDSIYVLPPLIVGCVFQFAYTMYVQVEFFEKKMRVVAVATSIAAIVNVILNFMLIPVFGYYAAAYTTLAGYFILFSIHYYTICSLGYKGIFNRKIILGGLGFSVCLMPIIQLLYLNNYIRYIAIAVYVLFILYIVYRFKEAIITFIRNRKSG